MGSAGRTKAYINAIDIVFIGDIVIESCIGCPWLDTISGKISIGNVVIGLIVISRTKQKSATPNA